MKHKHINGFTIVELLIVIVVIGVLAGLVLSSLTRAQADARNAQTISAALALRKALTAYALENGSYPIPTDTSSCMVTTGCTFLGGTLAVRAGFESSVRPYIGSLPAASTVKLDWGNGTDLRSGITLSNYSYSNYTVDGAQYRYYMEYYLEGSGKKCNASNTLGTVGGNYPAFTTQQNSFGATEQRSSGALCTIQLSDPAKM